jgi:N utilization substance protein B
VSGGRRAARRTALFLLYQWDVTGQPLASLYEGDIDVYARETAEAVAANAEEYDRRITEAAEGWTADRLGAIERNILRIALHELDRDDIPDEVAIDEAVNLAKRNRRCCTLGERHSWSNRQRARLVSAEESLARAEELLARLEQTRAELERLTQADDADKALDVLTELAELSKAIEEELQKAKREADAGAEP